MNALPLVATVVLAAGLTQTSHAIDAGLAGAAVATGKTPTPPAPTTPAIPSATQQPTGLGDDPAMTALAQSCFDGDMASCDRLYETSPAGSLYENYADTCAGRQPAGTGRYCVDVFGRGSGPTTTESSSGAAPDPDGMFTVGDIVIPPGEPDQLSIVLTGVLDESGRLPIIIRNNRDHVVYDIRVLLSGTDAAGAEVVAEYFISTAGVAPGGWTFGQNAIAAPGLGGATSFRVQFEATDTAVFLPLEVSNAELSGTAIAGTVTNDSAVTLGGFNVVNVACFAGQQLTAYQLAVTETPLSQLLPGESATFSTSLPIDPATCSSFAVYANGLPAS